MLPLEVSKRIIILNLKYFIMSTSFWPLIGKPRNWLTYSHTLWPGREHDWCMNRIELLEWRCR